MLATGSGLMIFDARYGPGATIDSPPDPFPPTIDLMVPTNELPALEQVIAEMKITGANDAEKRRAIETFSRASLLTAPGRGRKSAATNNVSPLTRFLLTSRSGHCEYFATATVLLLRQLGIPARYAVGYSVHETSGSGYVVRERDAHAWCLAWNQREESLGGFRHHAGVMDRRLKAASRRSPTGFPTVKSWIGFQFAKLRWRQAHLRQYILWTLAPVMLVLLYYIIFQRRTKSRPSKTKLPATAAVVWPGHDSAFYRLEKTLSTRALLPRSPGEPLADWLERALAEPALVGLRVPLQELLQLHYRWRFDPDGLDDGGKILLAQKVDSVLETLLQK